MCRNHNLNVQKKNFIKKDLEHLIYRQFWTSTRKTCIFNGKIFAGLSNLLFTCPEEHLQSNVSERKSWKLKDFWINFENFGTMAEETFRVVKTAKDVLGNSLWKKIFKNWKTRFFSDSERFSTSSENFRQICKTRSLRVLGSFWGRTVFEITKNFYTSLDFDPKNP